MNNWGNCQVDYILVANPNNFAKDINYWHFLAYTGTLLTPINDWWWTFPPVKKCNIALCDLNPILIFPGRFGIRIPSQLNLKWYPFEISNVFEMPKMQATTLKCLMSVGDVWFCYSGSGSKNHIYSVLKIPVWKCGFWHISPTQFNKIEFSQLFWASAINSSG